MTCRKTAGYRLLSSLSTGYRSGPDCYMHSSHSRYLIQVVAPSCRRPTDTASSGRRLYWKRFCAIGLQFSERCSRLLPLEPGDSLNYVGVFSFGTNLVMSDVNPQINYEQSPLHCHSLVDFSMRKKTQNDCLQYCRIYV